jgi:hypothetical protein
MRPYILQSLIIISVLLTGCTTNTSTTITDERPSISIIDAKSGDKLYLDERLVGDADNYNGEPSALFVESGRHEIMVISKSGKILMSESIYVTNGQTRELSIGAH